LWYNIDCLDFLKTEEKMNTVQIELPQAFSVRDVHEFTAHNHLLARLNAGLRVKPVAVGIHVNGGPTVYWGVVYHEDNIPSDDLIKMALKNAGFNSNHNGSQYEVNF
jgi:hypothetical protein